MEGKIVLITGSTTGLGLHTAKNLYLRGATLILTCRDGVRGRAALDAVQSQLKKDGDLSSGRVHLFTLDLTCYKSILVFCSEVKLNFDRIDVLVNNAGVMGLPFELSRNGVEMHFATNAFGHFVLVNNLLPLLEKSIDGRIVNYIPTLRQLMGEQDWDYHPRVAYAVSKLANCLYTVELASYIISVFRVCILQGIESIINCAVTPNNELNSGALYHGCKEEEYGPIVTEVNFK
ncbi:unnamed protein product [Angiostrongylus costaricensis]|uniref:Retinol dehydrogenase 14 n=1 Tax=Angiostrongylus costaricensis TaxID=334426 RepID=A0A0R3PP81_ANGCS|nr:unnamed protein product [Angiostrongylus costaricensis]